MSSEPNQDDRLHDDLEGVDRGQVEVPLGSIPELPLEAVVEPAESETSPTDDEAG
jgi:hypothetical protein